MTRRKSIRTQLIVNLVVGVILLETAAAAGLFLYVKNTLIRSFDATLASRADAIADSVHMEDDGQPHLEMADSELTVSPHGDERFFFELWGADGQSMISVVPPGEHFTLPHLTVEGKCQNIELPGNISARALQRTFLAQPDEDQFDSRKPTFTPLPVTLVLARDRHSIDQSLAIVLTGLIGSVILSAIGLVAIVSWSVRRGLLPLRSVAGQTERIGPESLDERFPIADLPVELQAVCTKLNELLDRLQSAFARERRLSADIAHELRTPVTELRSLCEVQLRWPDTATASSTIREALTIAEQMSQTVDLLTTLTRCQAGLETPSIARVSLAALLIDTWRPLEKFAIARGLRIEQSIPINCWVDTDAGMLGVVIRNLLANAAQHTSSSGRIDIHINATERSLSLSIGNTSTGLVDADLAHMQEPFWRKDSARTGEGNTGLGLTIVNELSRVLQMPLSLSLEKPDWFVAKLILPRPAANPGAGATDLPAAHAPAEIL